ncbi:MAG: TonB-dependent receptor plug domain-containing protein [Alphaproteobacteria bacterium]|nr:TonB-dependent receptor plug domain-containing protein [Alphaproteobacteria bacterium]
MNRDKAFKFTARLFAGTAICALAAAGALAQSLDDKIVVTAQRTEQSLQDVPIAVSAFGGQEMQNRQIESTQDFQFNVPNFQFSRSQFTNSNVSIRGVGNFVVAASSEDAVSVHMNDIFLSAPRLFETEFYDVERVEILRGPQGTLFGRNATGGVINVITNKADPSKTSGYINAEYGNYNSMKVDGAFNLPLGDRLAVRLAGTTIQRDGYTTNLYNNSKIDDRNTQGLRASVRWLPTNNTTIDFTADYLKEHDNRMRYQKQACEAGPQAPLLGCDPNGPRAFDGVDIRGTIADTASNEFFGAFFGAPQYGLFSLTAPLTSPAQPTDMRQVSWDTNPKYDAEESVFMVNLKHDFDSMTFKLNAGYGNSKIATSMDYDGGVGPAFSVPAATMALPGVGALFAGGFPISAFDVGITGTDGRVGVIGGNIQDVANNYRSIDLSIGESDYWSVEGILNSNFDGPINFLIGGSHLQTNGFANYAVASTPLDYFSVVGGELLGLGPTPPFSSLPCALTTGCSFYVPYYYNDTQDNHLNSNSIFGEVYFQLAPTLKLTGGVRHNWDTKSLRARQDLYDSFIAYAAGLPRAAALVPLGTQSVKALLDSFNPYIPQKGDFNATTGRAVLQWTPSDNAQLYASWTRGYKPGGFNPPTPAIFGVPPTFQPEIINAYEAGIKSNIGGHLQANFTGFYYDYTGLQVSRIVNRTAINDNIDAKIWGLEGEFVWAPTDRWKFNMNAGYLNTKLGDFSTFDPHNPTAGRTDVELIADITNGSNCVITRGASDPTFVGTFTASPFSVCSQLAAAIPTVNTNFGTSYALVPGIEQNVQGNQMQGAPKFKISGGVQYDMPMGGRFMLTPRVDAYYQSKMYTSIFERQQDLVKGYAYVNAQVRFHPTDGNWYLRAFVQNLTNNDAITGAYNGDQSSGTFQNLFILEPRRWGFGAGFSF